MSSLGCGNNFGVIICIKDSSGTTIATRTVPVANGQSPVIGAFQDVDGGKTFTIKVCNKAGLALPLSQGAVTCPDCSSVGGTPADSTTGNIASGVPTLGGVGMILVLVALVGMAALVMVRRRRAFA